MNVKVIDFAASKKRNEITQKRILQRQNEAQKQFVFPQPGTPLLSDKSEFPSLSESLGKGSSYLPSAGVPLKYSDKLKSPSTSKNQASVSGNMHLKCDTAVSDTPQHDYYLRSKCQSVGNKNKLGQNSRQNIPKQIAEHSLNDLSSDSKISNIGKKESTKQKPVLKSKLNIQNIPVKSSAGSSNDANIVTKSNNQSNKSVSVENCESQVKSSTAKKKKRKSKVKRQVALQSGKITFLTPEVHSKILNQASTLNAQNSVKSSIVGNINDEEEYPELGKVTVSQKENFVKKNNYSESQGEAPDKSVDTTVGQNVNFENIVKEAPVIIASEKTIIEKKDKNEKVHSHNPITISFYEMLLEKNVKKKEAEELKIRAELPNVIGLSKLKNKKNASHPHNLLDSSSPAVKRGKEREKPKPKKPSQLKKIILMDRKTRRENLLQMKNSSEEENIINEGNNQLTDEEEDQCSDFVNDLPALFEEREESAESVLQLTETTRFCDQDELISEMVHLNISVEINNCNMSDLSPNFGKVVAKDNFVEKISNLPLNERSRVEEHNNMPSLINDQSDVDAEMHLNIPHSPESLLNSLTTNIKCDISDKERAVKILLHTRNFREYCNHLISKDIDDATYALLDDLARFQDRLHQKDPVKARIKKRMIYGVKEVKKHIKLRKLKCIIIAVDIENVETQGGLNDILNEIKVSAIDHHIPCVFALSRKVLGKVCRKPVPVSCVGVFNYEGSEANFKKMVELQSQSKADYAEIFNKLLMKITDEEVATLIKTKKEAPETLRDVRANILSNFFQLPDSVKSENENIDLKSNDSMSDLFDNST